MPDANGKSPTENLTIKPQKEKRPPARTQQSGGGASSNSNRLQLIQKKGALLDRRQLMLNIKKIQQQRLKVQQAQKGNDVKGVDMNLHTQGYDMLSFGKCISEGGLARAVTKSKTQTTGHISADRGDSETENRKKRKGLEKDLKKKGIGYKKSVGKYKYDDGKQGSEVSYHTTPGKGMSKRKFGKLTRRLGRKHGQESVITKDGNKPARLHDTQSKKPGASYNIGKTKAGQHPRGDGETTDNKVRSAKHPKNTKKRSFHYDN